MARKNKSRRLGIKAGKSSFGGRKTTALSYGAFEPRKLLAADMISQSDDGQWLGLPTSTLAGHDGQQLIRYSRFGLFDLQEETLGEMLVDAPLEFTPGYENLAVTISVPRPDSTYARFRVVEAPIMEPGLAEQFPDIKTYRGYGIDDPSATIRLDTTMHGFHAQVLTPNGTWYVDPYFHLQTKFYASYFRADAVRGDSDVDGDHHHNDIDTAARGASSGARRNSGSASGQGAAGGPQDNFGTQLRTFRLANAATGEYTAFFGGTVAAGQAAIVTAINRVTGLYEKDLAIRLTLVATNSNIVYTNSATDPYTNNNGNTMLTQNQNTVDSVIGSANYDIGHVFSTGGGGIAGLGVVGFAGNKARGVTGSTSPVGDPFYIDYVAHEMGHQFNGNHSFNGCGGGGGAPSAQYEPGSGSTIMGYAGICGSDDLQSNSDAMFNFYSIQEIRTFITSTIPGVGVNTATGNSVPTVNAGLNYAIPTGTPFELTAVGSDANAGQTLTYSWEQRDLGPSQALTAADNGQSPLFRAWNPTTNPTRVFPRLSNLVNNTVPIGEKLPTVARASMDFRVVVRDNASGGGGVNWDDMFVNVVNTGSAFSVTSQNSATSWTGNSSQNITWNVAGTSTGTINTPNVDIWLSTDGGITYPTLLLAATPNDGSQAITVPNISTTQGRIKVKGTNNIFFDINNANITITPSIVAHIESGTLASVSEAGTVVTFAQPFTNPVVIVSPASNGFGFPVFASFTDLTTTSVRIHVDAWLFDNEQPFSESIQYVVFERGTIDLGGGARIIAGTTSAESAAFGQVNFSQSFGTTPAVVPSLLLPTTAPGRTTRLTGVNTTGFQIRTQQEEEPGAPVDEANTVHYLAMTPGRYTIGSVTIEAGITGNAVTHNPFLVNYSAAFAGTPVFTAHMQTYNEADSAVIRRTALTTTNATIYLDEEDSLDPELNHAPETVGFVVLRNN